MNPAGASQPAREHHGLTFHWPRRPQISLTLLGFLFLSILAHALAFYVFQIEYPSTAAAPPPPVQVNLLAATPENEALLKWIASEDPAAIANPHEIIPPNLLDVPYKPSFAEIRTLPKTFDLKEPDIAFPSARSPLYIIASSASPARSPAEAVPTQRSELKFSGALAGRKIRKEPPLQLGPVANSASLEPASFFVGVGPDGKVKYTFLINGYAGNSGSGNDSIDRQAEAHLRQIEFVPQDRSITWGVATYFWGSDAYDLSTAPKAP